MTETEIKGSIQQGLRNVEDEMLRKYVQAPQRPAIFLVLLREKSAERRVGFSRNSCTEKHAVD